MNTEEDTGWVEVRRGTVFSVKEQLRRENDELQRQLHSARKEIEVLTDERDNALYEAERWKHRYLIASGQGGP